MKNCYIITLFLIILFSAGCKENDYRLSTEIQVYEFVFNEIIRDATKEILIENTFNADYLKDKKLEDLSNHFEELNQFPINLLERVIDSSDVQEDINWTPIMVNAQFIDLKALNEENPNRINFWKAFKQEHPNHIGYYHISKAQIDYQNNEALVLVGYKCPALCGAHDTLIWVRKEGNFWSIVKASMFYFT
ncbi:MAG: hypothetical protein R3E90_07675 [Marinicella sp.]